MEKYELKNKYEYEDDEIDLVELLKSIVREKNLIIAITVCFTLLAGGFAFYKNSLPKTYSFTSYLKNNSLNLILKESNNILPEELKMYADKINSFIKPDEISSYISDNDILNLANKNNLYTFTEKTNEKTLTKEEAEIKDKLSVLNQNIDNKILENINEEIFNFQKKINILNKEIKNTEKELKGTAETYNLNLSSNNVSENLALINPVLYIKFEENKNKLTALYSNLENLKILLENYKEVLNLEFQEIHFENSKLNSYSILIIGLVLGLFAGMFIAIIKEPLKNILKEIKEEK